MKDPRLETVHLNFKSKLKIFAPDYDWDAILNLFDEIFPAFSMELGHLPDFPNHLHLENTRIRIWIRPYPGVEEHVKLKTLGSTPSIVIQSLRHKFSVFHPDQKE